MREDQQGAVYMMNSKSAHSAQGQRTEQCVVTSSLVLILYSTAAYLGRHSIELGT